MKEMIAIFADKGKILTDGTNYGTALYVTEQEKENVREMTLAEYMALMKEGADGEATEADYIEALGRLGVK